MLLIFVDRWMQVRIHKIGHFLERHKCTTPILNVSTKKEHTGKVNLLNLKLKIFQASYSIAHLWTVASITGLDLWSLTLIRFFGSLTSLHRNLYCLWNKKPFFMIKLKRLKTSSSTNQNLYNLIKTLLSVRST